MWPSLTFARFQRSTADDTCVSSELISEMMFCASASFEATGPGSAVAAEATPKAIAITQTTAGMWRILDLITDSPSGGKLGSNDALPLPRERHKVGRVTAFSDDRKPRTSQKVRKVSCLE